MAGLRIDFRPEERVEDTGAHRVVGGTLRITRFGAEPLELPDGESKPCTVRFCGRYVEFAREGSSDAFEPFAELSGVLSMRRGVPSVFLGSQARLDALGPSEQPSERQLHLAFDADTFTGVPAAESELRRLELPQVPDPKKEYRHFELGAELIVDGATVADATKNGVLDVPLLPVPAGLVLEWPADLDRQVPAGLTLIAKQGELERHVPWSRGAPVEGRRQFLFRGIAGPEPIDLTAAFSGRRVALWEAQDASRPEAPPRWATTLESAITVPCAPPSDDFEVGTTLPSNQVASGPPLAPPPA